jgi:hypothetical protein
MTKHSLDHRGEFAALARVIAVLLLWSLMVFVDWGFWGTWQLFFKPFLQAPWVRILIAQLLVITLTAELQVSRTKESLRFEGAEWFYGVIITMVVVPADLYPDDAFGVLVGFFLLALIIQFCSSRYSRALHAIRS